MKTVTTSGSYKNPQGVDVNYSYSFSEFENLTEAIAELGEAEVLKLVQRMTKVDANNTSREKAKVANGHSTRKVLTEEQKAINKADRHNAKALLDLIKSKGVTNVADLASLLG